MKNPPSCVFRVPGCRHGLAGLSLFALVAAPAAFGSAIYQDGASARSKALGGNATAAADAPLDALASNPAALSEVRGPTLEVGIDTGFVHGEFSNSANRGNEMNDAGVMGHGAISYPFGPVTLGLGIIPTATLRADWRFRDAPGGLDGLTSYGFRTHKSEISVLRFALGGSYRITQTFSAGASVGLLYNRNRLEAPYTLQTQPALAGAKVLLDLETEGWGADAQFGFLWKPLETLKLGVSYTLQSRVKSEGRAFAEARTQLKNLGVEGVDSSATFDAEVTNTFPQILSAGAAWQATPKLGLFAQIDWINWAGSFDTLEVRLRKVDNPLYYSLLGDKNNLDDDVPLDWHDQWVFRFGAEYALDEHWTLRAGYRYSPNPVPSTTLTPTTAAVNEHEITVGIGYKSGPVSVDLAYQWLPKASEHTSHTKLLNSEYVNSDVDVEIHWLSLTTTVEF